MFRAALLLALFSSFAALAADPPPAAESRVVTIEKEYRSRRQAALAAQWFEVRLPFETPAQFLARLLDTAREDDPRATAALGWEFQQRGDAERAVKWLARAAETGNPFAAYLLAIVGAAKDGAPRPAAIDWMQRAADAGLPDAQFEIALRFMLGKGAAVDLAAARDWFGRAAAQHYVPALCNLATLELQGQGGAADLAAAEQHFTQAAEAGFPQGFFGQGEVCRLRGRLAESVPFYEKAAEAGVADADFWLGCFALQLPGQPRDEPRAAQHFLRAAAGGHFLARVIAADFQRRGAAGVPADAEAPARLEPELEKLTDPQLIATLGGLFLEGKLVERDPVRALQFFRRAATQGQAAAQRWAGTLLATGEAGERNLEEAYQWLWLAARNGQVDAEPAFAAVVKAMNGAQIIEAARRAERFQSTPNAQHPTPNTQ